MNREIKLTLDIDSAQAAESLNKMEEQADRLAEKLNIPVNKENNEVNDARFQHVESQSAGGKSIPREENVNNLKSTQREFTAHQSALTGIEDKYSQQRKKISTEESRYKASNLQYLLQTTGVLFGKQGELYKGLSLAEATISAYNAANAALLPPPIGLGPILGEIQAGIVLMNSMKRVEKIAASKIPGYAQGGIVVGENGPEVIENMQDYAAGRAELIQRTIFALQNNLLPEKNMTDETVKEIKSLRADLHKILERPAIAFLNDREAKKIYYSGGYAARKNR